MEPTGSTPPPLLVLLCPLYSADPNDYSGFRISLHLIWSVYYTCASPNAAGSSRRSRADVRSVVLKVYFSFTPAFSLHYWWPAGLETGAAAPSAALCGSHALTDVWSRIMQSVVCSAASCWPWEICLLEYDEFVNHKVGLESGFFFPLFLSPLSELHQHSQCFDCLLLCKFHIFVTFFNRLIQTWGFPVNDEEIIFFKNAGKCFLNFIMLLFANPLAQSTPCWNFCRVIRVKANSESWTVMLLFLFPFLTKWKGFCSLPYSLLCFFKGSGLKRHMLCISNL